MARKDRSGRFVSRGGDKLDSALRAFSVDARGLLAADLGANVGGFTDCLLQAGAARVYAVETGYGVLDWRLRNDGRVVVLERTNALHAPLPERVDLVVVDVGWTPLRRIIPSAMGLLKEDGRCIALLKPQYEAGPEDLAGGHVRPEAVAAIEAKVVAELRAARVRVLGDHAPEVEPGGRNPERFLLLEAGKATTNEHEGDPRSP